jgi:hypothetical protein
MRSAIQSQLVTTNVVVNWNLVNRIHCPVSLFSVHDITDPEKVISSNAWEVNLNIADFPSRWISGTSDIGVFLRADSVRIARCSGAEASNVDLLPSFSLSAALDGDGCVRY